MKRAVIVHGWEGKPGEGWQLWLRQQLESNGFQVSAPQMPHAALPKLGEWLLTLRELISLPDEETYLVGHSLGCYTILKYLETLPDNQRIGGVVMVAGFSGALKHPIPILQKYYEKGLNYPKILLHCSNFVAIYSERDNYVRAESAREFQQHLGAKLIENNNWEHFSGVEGIKELPEVLRVLLEMSEKISS